MKKLDITAHTYLNGVMTICWHRYNDDNNDNNSSGQWQLFKELSKDEVLDYAKMHVDKDIEVNFVS